MHAVQATAGLLTEEEVLFWSNTSLILFAGVGSFFVDRREGSAWNAPLLTLDVEGWVLLTLFALLVYFGAALVQQYAVRRIGATVVATLMPVRLFAAVLGGMLLLGEPLRNTLEALGLLSLVAVVVTFIQVNSHPVAQSEESDSVNDADDQDDYGDYRRVNTDSVRGFTTTAENPQSNDAANIKIEMSTV